MADPQDVQALLQEGLSRHFAGDLAGAERIYRTLLDTYPANGDAYYLLGQLCLQQARDPEAIAFLRTAIECRPQQALFHVGLATALLGASEWADAAAAATAALEIEPTLVEALFQLSRALHGLNRFDEAMQALQMAVALEPTHAQAHAALGALFIQQGRWSEAEPHLAAAQQAGIENAEVANDLGVALKNLGRVEPALEQFRRALAIRPDYVEAAMNLGNALKEVGDVDGARHAYARVSRNSDCLRIRMATLLPPIYASYEAMQAYREGFASSLDELLHENLRACDPITEGGSHNFYLCYQGLNDRDLQQKLAQVYRKVYRPERRELKKQGRAKHKIRVGFISAFFKDHTIGHLNQGIIANLSRELFEVYVFSVGRHDDSVSQFIQAHADHFQAFEHRNLSLAETAISACDLDVLVYTDIGMEPFTYFLAFSRLAPVQCTTWGHPVTTGIDTIDYFLSSTHQESEGADAHYSEQLIRLNSLPAYYYPPGCQVGQRDRASFGLSDAAHLYFCPQSLFKFHPDFDALIAALLESDDEGELLIPEGHYPQWTASLRARFQRAMPHVVNRIRFTPRLTYDGYLQLMFLSDVILDPLHFGGGKTTLDGLSLGVPIVTLPSEFMRGRATAASYRQMGLEDHIAADAEDYVHKAIALADDPERRQTISSELLARKHLLAERRDMVRALEEFFIAAVESALRR